jgi:hypothetical protein
MRDVDVVVLSRFPEIFEGFRECVDRDAPELNKDVLWDQATKNIPERSNAQWLFWEDNEPFHMARSGNDIWKKAHPENDILYCGDDTRIIEPDTIKRLQELAYSDPEIGILSPTIIGLCAQESATSSAFDLPMQYLNFVGFVFVYIKRDVIEKIGYLDERFEGYGFEDLDYCYRARKAGFRVGMARDIHVKHGFDRYSYGSTFIRTTGELEMAKQDAANRKRFAEKWGLDPNDTNGIFAAIRDLSATEHS